MLLRSRSFVRALALAPALTSLLMAGGFFLTLGNPAASHDRKAKNAVLLVRPDGCGEPAKALVSGSAEGLVNGKRLSIPLKLVALDAPGTYAITRQWPAEGTWLLKLQAQDGSRQTGALVPTSPAGFNRDQVVRFPHAPAAEQADTLLQNLSHTVQAQVR